MSAKIMFYLGMFLVIIGLLHPLGLAEFRTIEYMLYVGIILFGLGIILLPGNNES